jgi:hypothetical protein
MLTSSSDLPSSYREVRALSISDVERPRHDAVVTLRVMEDDGVRGCTPGPGSAFSSRFSRQFESCTSTRLATSYSACAIAGVEEIFSVVCCTLPKRLKPGRHRSKGQKMSVVVVIHFPVMDVAKAIEGLHDNAVFLEEITESTKDAGIIHHRFVSGDGELVVIDEWERADQFQKFFDENPKVAEVMSSLGMTGPPAISVFEALDTAGTL